MILIAQYINQNHLHREIATALYHTPNSVKFMSIISLLFQILITLIEQIIYVAGVWLLFMLLMTYVPNSGTCGQLEVVHIKIGRPCP